VMPPLLAAASAAATGSRGGGAAKAALTSVLENVANSQHQMAGPWRTRCVDALRSLGADPQAAPQSTALSGAEDLESHPTKRQRLEPGAEQHRTIMPPIGVALEDQLSLSLPLLDAASAPLPTNPHDLAQVQTVFMALLSARDANTLAAFIGGLHPVVLADVVLANLAGLPPSRAQLAPDFLPVDPFAEHLMQLLAVMPVQPQPMHVQAGPASGAPSVAASGPSPYSAVELTRTPTPTMASYDAPPAETSADRPIYIEPKQPKPVFVPPAEFKLAPTELDSRQVASLLQSAVVRLLKAKGLQDQGLKAALVARLASSAAPEGDQGANPVVQLLSEVRLKHPFDLLFYH
jgi:hypothetical protein